MTSWTSIVSYENAIALLSTDGQPTRGIKGQNAKSHLDALSAAQCRARAHGAWMGNLREQFVAYTSAAQHKAA